MKLGMVFEGGASRTAFSCGVMDAFLEEELMPDYFIGVSAGIAFGVSYLSKQKGRNLKLLEEYMADKRYMGLKYLFDRKKKSYYNIGFLLPSRLCRPQKFFHLRRHAQSIPVHLTRRFLQLLP